MTRAWVAFAAATLLCACNPQVPKDVSTPAASPSPSASELSLRVTGSGTAKQPVRIVQQKGNGRQYELLARSFVSQGAPGTARASFTSPHVTFYGKNGSKMIADAPRAIVDQNSNIIQLLGCVTAHNSSGMALKCDTLTYDRATEMFHGTGNVLITEQNGFHATGQRIDSDITLTHTQMQ